MAKRRYVRRAATAVRRVYRRAAVGARRVYRKGARSAGQATSLLTIGFSFGYGYLRQYITGNQYFQQAIAYLPFGGAYKDNLAIGGLAYLIQRFVKPTNAYIKLALRTIIHDEVFIMGAKMQAGASFTSSSSSSSSSQGLLGA